MEANILGIIAKFDCLVTRKSYFFRQIFPDGRFYGEITEVEADSPCQRNISGTLSTHDYQTLSGIVDSLKHDSTVAVVEQRDGWAIMLAEGTVAHPVWMCHLKADTDSGSVYSRVGSILSRYG